MLACAGKVNGLPDSPQFDDFSERLKDTSSAETDQTIVIVGASPRHRIVLMWSSLTSQQAPFSSHGEIPCQDSSQNELGGAVGMSITRADRRGHALVQRRIGQPLDCERLVFQAVEPKTCRFSRPFDTRPMEYQDLVAPSALTVGTTPGEGADDPRNDSSQRLEEVESTDVSASATETEGSGRRNRKGKKKRPKKKGD